MRSVNSVNSVNRGVGALDHGGGGGWMMDAHLQMSLQIKRMDSFAPPA